MKVEQLLLLLDNAGGSRLPILGQLDPWADSVFDRHDLPQLEGDVDRLDTAACDDSQHELVAAMRKLLTSWRAQPNLMV
ncbi:hypothetical protein [Nonomuraea jabiensis]|uniref:hypothetical protein n=1 Tax=Nonomuraea jabiensis TaxID=882448 RepID=UPI003D712215